MKYDTRTGRAMIDIMMGTQEIAKSKTINTTITTTITGNEQKLRMPPYTKTITMKPPHSTTFETKEHLNDAVAKHDEIRAAGMREIVISKKLAEEDIDRETPTWEDIAPKTITMTITTTITGDKIIVANNKNRRTTPNGIRQPLRPEPTHNPGLCRAASYILRAAYSSARTLA